MMRSLLAIVLVGFATARAEAQVTVSGGLGWSSGYGIGDATAQLRSNAAGTTPPPFTLFSVDSRIPPATGAEVRVGASITRNLSIDGGAHFARRRLALSISGDREAPSQELAGESLQHFVFDAGLLWNLPIARGARVRTAAIGGGGYLRQLHQDRTLVKSGQIYYLGASSRYWLRGRPDSGGAIGLRGDVRLNLRRNGIEFANETRVYPTLSFLMFFAL